jgi:hypothetical protein
MMYRRNGPWRKSASDFDPAHFSCAFIAITHRCRGVCVKRLGLGQAQPIQLR